RRRRVAAQAGGGRQGLVVAHPGSRRRARSPRFAVLRAAAHGRTVPTVRRRMSIGVAILGSTGSIGCSTLQVLGRQRDRFRGAALANKETLVMAGELVTRTARECGGEIVPVDSEHSAVLQCVTGRQSAELARLILTASGGPFRTWTPERVAGATVDEALRHPTWKMGKKITVDSATLVNKALEVIEAHFLFGLAYDAVEVVVHPQSVVHAFVEFVDGSVLAQVG